MISQEDLKEKTFSFWGRTALRAMAWITLFLYMIFRIILPLVGKEPLYLDQNDGYVMFGCIGLLLSIEGVKLAVDKWLVKKTS